MYLKNRYMAVEHTAANREYIRGLIFIKNMYRKIILAQHQKRI